MGMFGEYEEYYNKYTKIYGEKTVVLYQNGDFYEMFGVSNEKENFGNVEMIAEMLNLNLTRKNRNIPDNDRSNYLLAGFNISAYEKYVRWLTAEFGYVVITVSQVGDAEVQTNGKKSKKGKKIRQVTDISSPSTNILYLSKPSNNYLISIYIEYEGKKQKQLKPVTIISIGISAIDISTSQGIVYHISNTVDDEDRALDDTFRVLKMLQPREVLMTIRDPDHQLLTKEELITKLELTDTIVHYTINTIPSEYYKVSYHEAFLGKLFKNKGMLSAIEYLDLEKYPCIIVSYLILLNYCYSQNENLLSDIDKPVFLKNEDQLILDSNCVGQLDIFNTDRKKTGSLYNILNHASTNMGKRMLKDRLLNPTFNIDLLNIRYNTIDALRLQLPLPIPQLDKVKVEEKNKEDSEEKRSKYFASKVPYLYEILEQHISGIADIERLHRKISLRLLHPDEFAILDDSYQKIRALLVNLDLIFTIQNLPQLSFVQNLVFPNLKNELEDYIQYYTNILNFDEVVKNKMNDIKTCFFKAGYNPEIDEMNATFRNCEKFFVQLAEQMSNTIGKKDMVTYDVTETEGYYIDMTALRYKTFLSNCKIPINMKIGGVEYIIDPKLFDLKYNKNKTKCKITSPIITEMSDKWVSCIQERTKCILQAYSHFIVEIYLKYRQLMKKLNVFVSILDMYKSCAKASVLYKYSRPIISSNTEIKKEEKDQQQKKSFVVAKELRHPIVERYENSSVQYIPQDIDLKSTRNILLFGLNASGKSITMKSVGVNIVMAQAGMFVAAKEFLFYPYEHLFTRIIGNDNMSKGLSSFAVEMAELRGIMNRVNTYSLLLIDELVRGSENISAVSISAATIVKLSRIDCNCIFATHLHQLSKMDRITNLKNVKFFHPKIAINEITGDITYERILVPGPGLSIYGIQVAKCMNLDPEIISLANEIRRELMGINHFLDPNMSRYNANIYMDVCGIPGCPEKSEETHHIKYQADSDENGYNDAIYKNSRGNLIPLCERHHQMITNTRCGADKLVIHGYFNTSDGVKLKYETTRLL